MSLDRHLSLERRRKLLSLAWKLYILRGTPQGLRLHIALCLGVEPQILEHFKLRRWLYLDSGRLGDQTLWGEAIMKRLHLDVYSTIGQFQLIDSGDPLRSPFTGAHSSRCSCPPVISAWRQMVQRITEASSRPRRRPSFVEPLPRRRTGVRRRRYGDRRLRIRPSPAKGVGVRCCRRRRWRAHFAIGSQSRIGSSTVID
jgi:hypothetical protein